MVDQKFEYRIVARNTLGDLEAQVRHMENERWELDKNAKSISLNDALDAVKIRNMVAVAMKRLQTEVRDE